MAVINNGVLPFFSKEIYSSMSLRQGYQYWSQVGYHDVEVEGKEFDKAALGLSVTIYKL